MTALVSTELRITVGVDTHADVYVAAAVDQMGHLLATQSVPSTPAGYRALVAWANRLGAVERFRLEGTSSYGAGLARWLRDHKACNTWHAATNSFAIPRPYASQVLRIVQSVWVS
jgi:Transposase